MARTASGNAHRSLRWAIPLLVAGSTLVAISLFPALLTSVQSRILPDKLSGEVDASGADVMEHVMAQRESDNGDMSYAPLDVAKLASILRLLGLLALANGGLVLLAARRSGTPRVHLFPIAVTASLLILMAGYRIAIGAGFGVETTPHGSNSVPSGIMLNDVDNLSYAAWAAQAREGRVRFGDLYTTEPHERVYVNPFFVAVGWLSRSFNVPVLGVLNIAGFIGAAVTMMSIYAIALSAGAPVVAARWAVFLTAFSSGLSGAVALLHATIGAPLLLGVDVILLEAISFTTFFCWPYHAFMLGLLSIAMLLITKCEVQICATENASASPPNSSRWAKWCYFVLVPVVLLLSFSHPYEGIMLLAVYGAMCGFSLLHAESRRQWPARARLFALLAVLLVPVAAYSFWVSRHDIWNHFAERSLGEWRPWWTWIIGYGLTLPLALAGALACLRRPTSPLRWLGCWTLLVVVLLLVSGRQATKCSNGAHLPLCIMAGLGCFSVVQWSHSLRRPSSRISTFVLGRFAVSLMVLTSFGMLLVGFRAHTYDRELQEVAGALKDESNEAFPAVLCDVKTGRLLSVLGPVRTYAAHYALTPDYQTKRQELIRAGIRPPKGEAEGSVDPAPLHQLLEKSKVSFVVLSKDSPARGAADESAQLEPVHVTKRWRVYRRVR